MDFLLVMLQLRPIAHVETLSADDAGQDVLERLVIALGFGEVRTVGMRMARHAAG